MIGGHIYCGWRCRLADIGSRIGAWIGALSRRQVHIAWTIAIVAGASALVLSVIGVQLAAIADLAPVSPVFESLEVSGRLIGNADDIRLDVQGPENGAVLIAFSDQQPRILRLDDNGGGSVENVSIGPETTIDLIPLRDPLARVTISEQFRSEPVASPTSTVVPSATTQPKSTVARLRATPAPDRQPTPTRKPRKRYPGAPPILHLVNDAGRVIALTFDGGSSSNGVTDLLNLMHEHDIRTTLFLTGEFIEREPALVRQAVLAGHEVGNHSYSHRHFTTYNSNRNHLTRPDLSKAAFESELRRTEQAFFRATGKAMAPLWRSPYGEENPELRQWALDLGYLHVRWSSLDGKSLDSRDWIEDEHSSLYEEPATMMKRLLSFPRLEGGIVLMHLASDRITPPWSQLPMFLQELGTQRIEVVKVTTMLERSPRWRPWLERARRRHQETWGR